MSKLVVGGFTVSIDGYGAGPSQSLEAPLGVGGEAMHDWLVSTRTFKKLYPDGSEGTTGIDDEFAGRYQDVGAYIMGRNMFGPIRGPWPDENWRGWWGGNPPYHVPVFVLTHHRRAPLPMEGGTVFHFVTDGFESALAQAKAAAGGKNIRIGGGAATIRQYLETRLVDEAHIAISPILLGSGEPLFQGLDLLALGYACTEHVASDKAMHVVLSRAK